MSQNVLRHKAALAVLSGVCVFLAFEKFNIIPLLFLFPLFFNVLAFECKTIRQGFWYGFLTSFVIMLGGFYWVTYVLHEFGYLPWSVSVLLYLCFCGFGALNFPLFVAVASQIHRKIPWLKQPGWKNAFWFSLGLPALFVITEFLIPKLFPWYVGHALYRQTLWIQISEITGSLFLSFCVYSLGSSLGFLLFPPIRQMRRPVWILAIPLSLWVLCFVFGWQRLHAPQDFGRRLDVALVQANIGNIDKVAAEKGISEAVKLVEDRYESLTREAVATNPRPDLILWPETAMPFQLQGTSKFAEEIRGFVSKIGIPLITGGYSQSLIHYDRDYNAAYLLNPKPDGSLDMQIYGKNILLAFGEYLPLGDQFPILYRWFPEIANFERGTDQKPLVLSDGTRIGVSICYEGIVPSFFRKVVQHHIHAAVNLTNDSWYGPTSEPYLHGSLTVFRAIEGRVPFFRVTNTGTSFAVDEMGRLSSQTGLYTAEVLRVALPLPKTPPETFYVRYGDWFVIMALGLLLLTLSLLIITDASFSI